MSKITPYLIFNGNCAEAFRFYGECLDGEVTVMQTYGDANPACPAPLKSHIMHVHMQIGDSALMGSDSQPENQVSFGDAVQVSLDFSEEDDQTKKFNAMARGGEVTLPLQDMFWGARFGMLTDRFGIAWMFNCSKK